MEWNRAKDNVGHSAVAGKVFRDGKVSYLCYTYSNLLARTLSFKTNIMISN